MQISRRVTNGLAWAGLLLVVGVPSADIISAQVMGEGASPRAAVVGKPMVIEPAVKPRLDEVPQQDVAEVKAAPVPADRPDRAQTTTASTDPVDQYLQSGRELPSYISDGGETQTAAMPQETQPGAIPATQAPATKPVSVETASVEDSVPATAAPSAGDPIDPVEVASINPSEKVAPVPMPLAMRPAPIVRPTATQEALIIPDDSAPDFPVIVPDPDGGFPVVPPSNVGPNDFVSAAELEEWESGPLSEFLAERSGGSAEPGFNSDGFFLDEGPDSSATYRRRQLPPDVVYVFPLN